MQIDIEIRPRKPFREFLACKKRWMTIVAHRRAGKTVAVIQKLILEAMTHKRKGMDTAPLRYFYCCPTLSQAKSVSWSYLLNFTADIPNIIVNHSELRVTFPNRAEIRLLSGENAERARGLYADGIVLDEVEDIPYAHQTHIFLPCLLDYNGWMICMGTPKGKGNLYKEVWPFGADGDVRPRFQLIAGLRTRMTSLWLRSPMSLSSLNVSMRRRLFLLRMRLLRQGLFLHAEA